MLELVKVIQLMRWQIDEMSGNVKNIHGNLEIGRVIRRRSRSSSSMKCLLIAQFNEESMSEMSLTRKAESHDESPHWCENIIK